MSKNVNNDVSMNPPILTHTLRDSFTNSSEKIRLFTALCIQICSTFLQVFCKYF